MKNIPALTLLATLLSGCVTIPGLEGKLDNRVACTAARDKAFVVSEYGPVGVASTIAKADADVICPKAVTAAVPTAAASASK